MNAACAWLVPRLGLVAIPTTGVTRQPNHCTPRPRAVPNNLKPYNWEIEDDE